MGVTVTLHGNVVAGTFWTQHQAAGAMASTGPAH